MRFLRNIIERMKSRAAGRESTEHALSFADDGLHKKWLTLENTTGSDHLKWAEIVSAKVFKLDLFAVDCICIAFERTAGTWFNIDEEMSGWQAVIESLPEHLPGVVPSEEWWGRVAFPAFATNEEEIFRLNEERPNKRTEPTS